MKELLKNRNSIKLIPSSSTFDYLPNKNHKCIPIPPCVLSFRIVRFKITDDTYETVVTKLDVCSFPADELKKLYHMRWGDIPWDCSISTQKKTESVLQEIFASLIMFNFAELLTSQVISQKKNRKYTYKADFSAAVHICRQFLLGNVSPPDLETMIARYVSLVRPGKNYQRNLEPRSAVSFLYRIV